MMVSILLAVLLIASLYMIYSMKMAELAVATQPAAAAPTAPTQPTQPTAPTTAPVDIKLTAADHILGDKNAKVIMVEYSDFQCPFCGRAEPTVQQVITTYGKDVAFVYRHFPLTSLHENARPAALASECANEQGKFWEYHDVLYKDQTALTQTDLIKYATDLKLNVTQFTTCLTTEKYASVVDGDEAQGQTYGVQGTPAFFINGELVSGAQPFAKFKAVIDKDLAATA
jgi:protein-disulfide isomerase